MSICLHPPNALGYGPGVKKGCAACQTLVDWITLACRNDDGGVTYVRTTEFVEADRAAAAPDTLLGKHLAAEPLGALTGAMVEEALAAYTGEPRDAELITKIDREACAVIREHLDAADKSGRWFDALWSIESVIAKWYSDRAAANDG